jgi:hypothetical protein
LNSATDDSVAIEGINEITFSIDKDSYFVIENKNRHNDDIVHKKIEDGLRRREQGISLATMCEFFDYFYQSNENARVRIVVEGNCCKTYLPIFNGREKKNEDYCN